jgi:hypothetical protein
VASWVLGEVLGAAGVFGQGLSARQAHRLGMSCALQCEALGEFGWAMWVVGGELGGLTAGCGGGGSFVAGRLRDPAMRRQAVTRLACKHIASLTAADLALLQREHVPAEVLCLARAFRAKFEGDVNGELVNLCLARDWPAWQRLMGRTVGPKLVTNGETGALTDLLHSAVDLGWDVREADAELGLFVAYLDAAEAVQRLKEAPGLDAARHTAGLLQGLLDRCARLGRNAANAQVASWAALRAMELSRVVGRDMELDLQGGAWGADFQKRLAVALLSSST